MTAGDIYTIAGNGTAGYTGDGGPATTAELYSPDEVAVDSAGNLVIADTNNNRVRVVAASTGTFYGQAMTAGDIYTIAGDGTAGYSGDGGPATTAELNSPSGVDHRRRGQYRDRRHQQRSDPGGGGQHRHLLRPGHDRRRHLHHRRHGSRIGFSGDGGPAVRAELNQPDGVAVDGAGNLLIADAGNRRNPGGSQVT